MAFRSVPRRGLVPALALALACVCATAQTPKAATPAVVYDMGGKFDRSFNEAAYTGMERFKKTTGSGYFEFEIANDTQREQALRRMAQRGADPVVAVGFMQASAVARVAAEFPGTRFVLVDAVVRAPNVRAITFKEHEGSFLAGALAALSSRSGKVGFIGGMDIPLIRRFQCGYEQGARYARRDVVVSANMTGTTPAAWTDPTRGGELARSQFSTGVDVVFAAAGGTGLGVYHAAREAGRLAIGVDSNQNHLHPGTMLTSMVKRVDVAVYDAAMAAREGRFQSGHVELGLKEQGVGLAFDRNNAQLIPERVRRALAEAEAGISSGKLRVADSMTESSCK